MTVRQLEELVLFWKRRDGLRCVALKHPPASGRSKRWEVRIVRLSRVIKREVFNSFRSAMRAAEAWRGDYQPGR